MSKDTTSEQTTWEQSPDRDAGSTTRQVERQQVSSLVSSGTSQGEAAGGLGFSVLSKADRLSIEEPLEIVIVNRKDEDDESLVVTMRTPGNDIALAAGFMFTEGLISSLACIEDIYCGDVSNKVFVQLASPDKLKLKHFQRNFYSNSSCGICGKTSIEALAMLRDPQIPHARPKVSASVLQGLPAKLHEHQLQFLKTGGIHAAALFQHDGNLVDLYEDIGRHNALDKLIGAQLMKGALPNRDAIVLVSGRASFELLQKVAMAELPILASIGAPSSLALDMAKQHGISLIGFLSGTGFNLYHDTNRVVDLPQT